MSPILLFADRLPPQIGGMEMHAGAFIEHFRGHPRFPLSGVVTRDASGRDVLLGQGPTSLAELRTRVPRPSVVFFNSGRWIERMAEIRESFPTAWFAYRTGGNEIVKAPLDRHDIPLHRDRQAWWVRQLNQCLDELITNSAFTERRLTELGVSADLFSRCVGGVEPQRSAAPSRETPGKTLLCAARFVPYKNHDLLLRVVEALVVEGLDLRLRLAGDGPLLAASRRLVSQGPLAGRVDFLGAVDPRTVTDELRGADFYIQLSGERLTQVPGGSYVHAEGMGRSILEALSCGTYVISTSTGALPEVVTPERGLLVEPSRDPAHIADVLRPLLRGPTPRPEPQRGLDWQTYFSRYEANWEARCER